MTKPRVDVLALGGTIAMDRVANGGLVPTLTAAALVDAVPGLSDVADVHAAQVLQRPGADLHVADIVAIVRRAHASMDAGVHGIVVTQGTDTLEETAFVADLLHHVSAPLVFTGAMRNPTQSGADGPANLLAAVRVAADHSAAGVGVVVVFADQVHAARFVRKSHASSPGAFVSSTAGPIGWVAEDRVRIPLRPTSPPRIDPESVNGETRNVALVRIVLGDDGELLRAVRDTPIDGLVVEAFGVGHVPEAIVDILNRLAQRVPVVFASRTGSGETFRATYGFAGSERELRSAGLISAGALDGSKSRLLLALGLETGWTRERITEAFDAWSS